MMDIVTLIMACSMFQDYSITNAMIQVGSRNTTLMVTPKGDNAITFPTANQAVNYINEQTSQDNVVNIGLTQIPSDWLDTYKVTPLEVIRPCKNVAMATQIITEMWEKCGHIVSDPTNAQQIQACTLSMFKTGDPQTGLAYAKRVMDYAASHPFAKLAAPAMAHWEKYAKVPKLPSSSTPTISKADNRPPVAVKPTSSKANDTTNNDVANDLFSSNQ